MVAPQEVEVWEGAWYPATLPPKPISRWASRIPAYLAFVVGFGAVLAGVLATREEFDFLWFGVFLGAAVQGIGRFLLWDLGRFETLAIRPEDAPMLPELGVPHGFLASVWVMQGHAMTGQDRGAMWVENDRLLFSGRSMSFALTRDMVVGGLRRRTGPGQMELELSRSTEAGALAVSFTPLFGDRPYLWDPRRIVAEWLEWAAVAREVGQFPPTKPGPNAETPKSLRRRLVVCVLRESAFFGPIFLPLAIYEAASPLILSAVAACALLGYWVPLRKVCLALRDSRRVAEAP